MNLLRLMFTGGVLLVVVGTAFAQRIEVEVQPLQRQPIGAVGEAPLLTPASVEKLKLTADQKDKYGKIEVDYKDAVKAAQTKFRNDIQNLNDREKRKEAQDMYTADLKKTRDDALAKVEPTLTAEQKTVFAQVKGQQPLPGGLIRPVPVGGGGIGQVLPAGVQQRLQLTDEQKKQIEAIQKEVEAKIMKVLTDDQKKQLETMKKGVIIRPQPQPANPNLNPRRLQLAQPAQLGFTIHR